MTDATRSRSGVDVTVLGETLVRLTTDDLAKAFSVLDADQQAQFFAAVDRVMQSWPEPASPTMQRYAIAASIKSHGLAEAKEWLLDLAADLEYAP